MSGESRGADGEAGAHAHNRLTGSTVHGTVVQTGRADVLIRASDPVEQAVPVTVAPPLGLRAADRPLRGRADLLARLEAAPAGERLLVLCGMGGCGKTALALEIAARRTAAGCRVWWVEARNGPALEAGLRAVARQAGAEPEELERGDTADVLWSRLARLDAPWLLVVDNADDPALLDGPGSLNAGTGWIRPATGAGTILVTTRESTPATWGPPARLHPLRPLTGDRLDDAARILRDHAPATAGTEAEARSLAARLGGLPLALRLAGTYLTEANRTPAPFRAPGTPTTYADYQRAREDGPQGLDSAHVLPRTWAMSLDLLEQRGHAHARPLLELIASFADADLPYTLLLTPDRLSEAGPLATLDGPTLWQHLTALAALGLIDLPATAPDGIPVLRMHPLVRDASRTPEAAVTAARILVAAADADETGIPEEAEFWGIWQLLSPHLLDSFHLHQSRTGGLVDGDLQLLAGAVNLAGRYLRLEGLHTRARAEFEAVVEVEREQPGESKRIATRFNLAMVLRDLGELEAARAEFEAVHTIECERYGDTHAEALMTRHERALVLFQLGELDAARAEFEAIVAARRECVDGTGILAARFHLAQILYQQSDLEAARREFEAVLAVEREQLGDTHPETLTTRHHRAMVLRDLGESEDAQDEFEAVLVAWRERFDETHPRAVVDRARIAELLYDMGDMAAAKSEQEAVLAAASSRMGDTHPRALVARHNLALSLFELGELETAREEFEAVLAIEREQWGDFHVGSLPTRRYLALVLCELGELDAARADLEAVLEIQLERFDEDHPETIAVRRSLAGVKARLEAS
ncbi:tetratricopeptide repeat protein [Kitasatospora sp. NPDC008115]|uniref:tetratricopeptide repeat protein n=1 Tax=Kitasatospora sp. NPDC008115 TaxID=3364022 RepID=UPI0036EBC812